MAKRTNNVKEPKETGTIPMSEEAKAGVAAALAGGEPEPIEQAPVAEAAAPAESPIDPETRAEVLRLMQDPEIARGLLATVLSTPEGRRQLNVPMDQGRPMGVYQRDYDNEPHLRVYGGVEVRHDANFCPRPPSNVPMYMTASGGTTDSVEPVYKPAMNGRGDPIYDDGGEPRLVLVAEGPVKDENGMPVKTEGYKAWIDSKMTGRHLDSNVRADIAAGKDPHFSADGIPSFVASDEGHQLRSTA